MSGSATQMRQVIRTLTQDHGCEARMTGSNHWRVTGPDGRVCFLPSTPSKGRWYPNVLSTIRTYLGVDLRR